MAPMSQRDEIICLVFYAVTLLVTLATFTATFINYHLFPLDTDNLNWSNAWLLAFVIEYYGVCLCFCGVVVASERAWWTTILWVLACLIVGSPACCLYIFLWVTKEGGTLRLERGPFSVEALTAAANNAKIDAIVRPAERRVHFDSPSAVLPHHHHHPPPPPPSSLKPNKEKTRTPSKQSKQRSSRSSVISPTRSSKQKRRDRDLERAVLS